MIEMVSTPLKTKKKTKEIVSAEELTNPSLTRT
jgi:hypothetical protein